MAENDEPEGDENEHKPRPASGIQIWLEEAWAGWLQQVGLLVLCAAAVLVYKFDLVSERLAGAGLVIIILAGAIFSTASSSYALIRNTTQRALFFTLIVVWAIAVGYPSLRAAVPPLPLGETHLTAAQLTNKVHVDRSGPFEITVGGRFKHAGMADEEADYNIKAEGNGSAEILGALKREIVRTRAGRRGGTNTSIAEHTEETHRVPGLTGQDLTFSTESIDDHLEDGLTIAVRPMGLDPRLFMILGLVALLLALGLDARLTDPKAKTKSYLSVGVALTAVFALRYPEVATPHSLVPPAVDAFVLALIVGGLGGWLLGFVARKLFGPPKAKKASRR